MFLKEERILSKTKVVCNTKIDKIELIYMAVVFVFCCVPYFFVNCPPKLPQIKALKSVTTSLRWSEI